MCKKRAQEGLELMGTQTDFGAQIRKSAALSNSWAVAQKRQKGVPTFCQLFAKHAKRALIFAILHQYCINIVWYFLVHAHEARRMPVGILGEMERKTSHEKINSIWNFCFIDGSFVPIGGNGGGRKFKG